MKDKEIFKNLLENSRNLIVYPNYLENNGIYQKLIYYIKALNLILIRHKCFINKIKILNNDGRLTIEFTFCNYINFGWPLWNDLSIGKGFNFLKEAKGWYAEVHQLSDNKDFKCNFGRDEIIPYDLMEIIQIIENYSNKVIKPFVLSHIK